MIAFDLFDLIIIKSSLNVAGDMHLIRKKEISASDFSYIAPNRQKVHTKVVDATVDKIYSKTINSTVEYIFQYSYTLNENQALSVQIDSTNANKEYPILAVVRQQKSVLSWQLPMFIETASAGP